MCLMCSTRVEVLSSTDITTTELLYSWVSLITEGSLCDYLPPALQTLHWFCSWGHFFVGDNKKDDEIKWWLEALIWAFYRTNVVTRRLSRENRGWVMTERMRSKLHEAEMTFLCWFQSTSECEEVTTCCSFVLKGASRSGLGTYWGCFCGPDNPFGRYERPYLSRLVQAGAARNRTQVQTGIVSNLMTNEYKSLRKHEAGKRQNTS